MAATKHITISSLAQARALLKGAGPREGRGIQRESGRSTGITDPARSVAPKRAPRARPRRQTPLVYPPVSKRKPVVLDRMDNMDFNPVRVKVAPGKPFHRALREAGAWPTAAKHVDSVTRLDLRPGSLRFVVDGDPCPLLDSKQCRRRPPRK